MKRAIVSAGSEGEPLLLSEFSPHTMLKCAETLVARAKYPCWDMHNHIGGFAGSPENAMGEVLAALDACNVTMVIDLSAARVGWREQASDLMRETLRRNVELYGKAGNRFIPFTTVDWSQMGDSAFPRFAVERLEEDAEAGAKGVKIAKGLGLRLRDPDGKLLAVNTPLLDGFFERCGQLRLPVMIHVADPAAFFLPVDGNNERYEELSGSPRWGFSGPEYPSREEILRQRDELVARHPGHHLHRRPRGQQRRRPGLRLRDSGPIPQSLLRYLRPHRRVGPTALHGTQVLHSTSGPHLLRH